MNGFEWNGALRTIAYNAPAQSEVDRFVDPDDRFQDQLMAIEWLLCRTPHIGRSRYKENPDEYLVYVVKEDTLAETSEVWILYSFDDDTVTVHGLKVLDDQ